MSRYGNFRRSALLIALLMMPMVAVSVMASQRTEETPPARWKLAQPGMIPLATGAGADNLGTARDQVDPAAPSDLVPHSAMAFQAFVDGSWEILYQTHLLPESRRLTANGSADILPSLNRGSNQIAFASNRDGDFEIFVMDEQGGNVRQLTFNSTDDVGPTWSPDGQQIAFEAYRDGNAEIYVMNVDGSAQRRLTSNDAYDGMPEWSPSGSHIAVVSNRSGGYRIIVMDSNGTNLRQVSNLPFSFHPSWSPDGTRLLFDADADGDGWQDLLVINADGTGQQMIFDPRPPFEAYAASWSPDGREVAAVELYWIEYQGDWYIQRSQIFKTDPAGTYMTNAVLGNTNLYAHWETTDAQPPQTAVTGLPPYMPVDGFQLQWSGEDRGPAGLSDYDIQYRRGQNGPWVDWRINTQATSAPFPGASGVTTFFRSRATDSHLNVEAWPEEPDAFTTFYEWNFVGHTVDNRGAPVSGVEIGTAGELLWPIVSGDEGQFSAYTVDDLPLLLAIHAAEYGPLPITMADPQRRFTFPITLPPADNVLGNSTFEQPPGPLQAWTVSGDLPVQLDESTAATGSTAVSLGDGCTTPSCLGLASLVPGTDSDSGVLAATSDQDGALHVLWQQYPQSTGQMRIMHSRRAPDGVWSTPVTVDSFPQSSSAIGADLVSDSNGRVHAAWHDSEGLKVASRSTQGAWTAPRVLRDLPLGYGYNMLLELLITPDDRLQLFYIENYTIYHMERNSQGRWSPPAGLWTEHNYQLPGIAAGPDNRLHIAAMVTGEQGDTFLAYRWRNKDGIWSTAETVPTPPDRYFGSPELLVDSHNTIHLLVQDSVLIHARRHPGRNWSAWQDVQASIDGNRAIEVDSRGRIHMIYGAGGEGRYRLFLPGSGWQPSVDLAQPFSNVQLEIDNFDNLHALFSYFSSALWYRGPSLSGSSGTAAMSQQVTVPETLDAPTLTFMARAAGDRPGDETKLNLTVDDGIHLSTSYSWDVDAGWQTYWADLGEWSGATISLTIALQQTADDPALRVWLDDVTLGSAHANAYVSIHGAADAAPRAEATYRIRFGNAGGVDASGANLVVTLPPELAFVSASPPPTSAEPLTWDLGVLPAGHEDEFELTLGVDAAVPPGTPLNWQAQLSSAGTELRTADNEDEMRLLVGYRVLLPAVRR